MGRLFAAACAAVAGFSSVATAVQAQPPASASPASPLSANPWTATVNTDVRYFGWASSLGASGRQIYAPVGVQVSGQPTPD